MPLPNFVTVTTYRTDDNRPAWAWRCWGSGDCDGWLHLDCGSEQRAQRLAERHLADHHSECDRSQT
ncbi:hypothetical protein [Streptomyces racemochromogenes]|uniref:hypothetical protein n=1 Tax=Streptomyces racemochromogenes TaxID=67353 RepID=UPI0031ECF928